MRSTNTFALALSLVLVAASLVGCARMRTSTTIGSFDADPARSSRATRAHVMSILRDTPLIDGHNDTPGQYLNRARNRLGGIDFASDTSRLTPPMHTDLPRLRAGGVGAQFWSVYIPIRAYPGRAGDARAVIEQIDVTRRLIDRYEDLELALTADDIVRIHRNGRIASLIGMEGGHSIENSLAVLRATYDLGARYMTLTHSDNLAWADSATDTRNLGGLSPFGREVVREMNRLGMLVDLSHVSPEVMHDALDTSEAPVIFSHSSARAVTDHPRNVPDSVLRRLRETDGVVMVTFVPTFVSEQLRRWTNARADEVNRLRAAGAEGESITASMERWERVNPRPTATLDDVADHIDHVRRVAGIERVGIGGDYDGIPAGPRGLEDVSKYPDLFIELVRRGYTDDDLRAIAGGNLLRVMRRAELVAAGLQRERGPSEARIEDTDGADPLRASR